MTVAALAAGVLSAGCTVETEHSADEAVAAPVSVGDTIKRIKRSLEVRRNAAGFLLVHKFKDQSFESSLVLGSFQLQNPPNKSVYKKRFGRCLVQRFARPEGQVSEPLGAGTIRVRNLDPKSGQPFLKEIAKIEQPEAGPYFSFLPGPLNARRVLYSATGDSKNGGLPPFVAPVRLPETGVTLLKPEFTVQQKNHQAKFELDRSAPLELAWQAPQNKASGRIKFTAEIIQVGADGLASPIISCAFQPNAGSGVIPVAALKELDIGVRTDFQMLMEYKQRLPGFQDVDRAARAELVFPDGSGVGGAYDVEVK